MNRQYKVEIWVGVFVLMSIISVSAIAFKVSNFEGLKDRSTYHVSALFMNIGGLKVRAPVKISGVVIGRVDSIVIDPVTFQARVGMDIYQKFNMIPSDTAGSILTAGLLGDQYVGLEPGGEDDVLEEGSEIELTQPALVLEDLIGQFLTKSADGE